MSAKPVEINEAPAIGLDDGAGSVLAEGWAPPDGWALVFEFRQFPSFRIVELRRPDGVVVSRILDRTGARAAESVESLSEAEQQTLRAEASPVLAALIQAFLTADPHLAAEPANYFQLNADTRAALEALCGELDLKIPHTTAGEVAEDVQLPDGGPTLSAAGLRQCLTADPHAQYLNACRSGRMAWPSPVDGEPVDEAHGLPLSPLVTAWRCVDRRHRLVFFVVVSGFDQSTMGVYLPGFDRFLTRRKVHFGQIPVTAPILLDWLAKHVLVFGPALAKFLTAPPRRFAHHTWPSGIAHLGDYLGHELPGLERIVDGLQPHQFPLVFDLGGAGGASFYGPLVHLFPELADVISQRFATIPPMLHASYGQGVQVMRFSGAFVSDETRKRIGNIVAGWPASESARRALWGGEGPVVVFGLRVENRTLTDSAKFYIALAKRLARRFGALTVILDGHVTKYAADRTASYRGRSDQRADRKPVEVELEIAEAIEAGLEGQPVTVINAVGLIMLENLAWLSQAHFCVAPWGSGLAKSRWACNLPAYVLVSQARRDSEPDLHIYDDPAFMEGPARLEFSAPEVVTDMPGAAPLAPPDPSQAALHVNFMVDVASAAKAIGDALEALADGKAWSRRRPHADFQIENDVVIGEAEELFLASGGHHVLDYVLRYRRPLRTSALNFRSNIASRAAAAAAIGARYCHLIYPDKQSVLNEAFGVAEPFRLGEHLAAECEDVWGHVIYPLQAVRASPAGVYLHTDSHMSDYGTMKVIHVLLNRLFGAACDDWVEQMRARITFADRFLGDLGRKLAPPRDEPRLRLDGDPLVTAYFNSLAAGNNGMSSVFLCTAAPRRERLVVFGDSFGQVTAAILASLFREVVFFRSPYMHRELLEMIRPDILITQNVERYLQYVLPDEERPEFALMNAMAHAELPAERKFATALSAMLAYGRTPYRRFMDRLELDLGQR